MTVQNPWLSGQEGQQSWHRSLLALPVPAQVLLTERDGAGDDDRRGGGTNSTDTHSAVTVAYICL